MLPDPALLLGALAAEPFGFFVAVVALSFLLEDATAVAAGALASQMRVDPVLALSAVMVGTVAGDLLLHGAGRWAGHWPRLARRLGAAAPLQAAGRSYALVAAARFVPGLRLPAYAGSGIARMPFAGFAAIVLLTGLLWTPLLFGAGSLLSGPRTGAVLAALALGLVAAPRLLRAPLVRLGVRTG